MAWSNFNSLGQLIEHGDDVAQVVTEYDPNTGAVLSTAPYTAAQIAQGQVCIAAATADTNLATLQQRAQNALQNNTTYLGIASPNNAQVVAQVGRLTRQVNALIRMDLRLLDTISDS